MIEVQAVRFGASWSCGVVVASPLRVELGRAGQETTVDGMLKGEGFAVMEPGQLAHLVAGMVASPAAVQMKRLDLLSAGDSLALQSTLALFGYTVESC